VSAALTDPITVIMKTLELKEEYTCTAERLVTMILTLFGCLPYPNRRNVEFILFYLVDVRFADWLFKI